jgi:hypothetical protein
VHAHVAVALPMAAAVANMVQPVCIRLTQANPNRPSAQ